MSRGIVICIRDCFLACPVGRTNGAFDIAYHIERSAGDYDLVLSRRLNGVFCAVKGLINDGDIAAEGGGYDSRPYGRKSAVAVGRDGDEPSLWPGGSLYPPACP